MALSWSSAELGPIDVCKKAFMQREPGASFSLLPKSCRWAQIPSQFMQVQSHEDLVTKDMVSSLAGSADMGLCRKQWCALPQTFTQLGKAGSSTKKVLMQELMAKRHVKQAVVCVIKLNTVEGGNQSYVEMVAFELKERRDQEGLTGKSYRLAIHICAKWTSNISEFTPSEFKLTAWDNSGIALFKFVTGLTVTVLRLDLLFYGVVD